MLFYENLLGLIEIFLGYWHQTASIDGPVQLPSAVHAVWMKKGGGQALAFAGSALTMVVGSQEGIWPIEKLAPKLLLVRVVFTQIALTQR